MNEILILSDNEELITFCNGALAIPYQINTVADLTVKVTAADQ